MIGAADARYSGSDDQDIEMFDGLGSGRTADGYIHLTLPSDYGKGSAASSTLFTANASETSTLPNSERYAPIARPLQDPWPVVRQGRYSREAAATGIAVRPCRPTDDADQRRDLLVLKYRPAGIAGASAKARLTALGDGIDQPDLQRARFSR